MKTWGKCTIDMDRGERVLSRRWLLHHCESINYVTTKNCMYLIYRNKVLYVFIIRLKLLSFRENINNYIY